MMPPNTQLQRSLSRPVARLKMIAIAINVYQFGTNNHPACNLRVKRGGCKMFDGFYVWALIPMHIRQPE